MQISGFDNKDKWIKLDGGLEVLVDYMTAEQSFKYNRIVNGLVKNKELTDEQAIDMFEIASYYIKYTVKDWKGLFDNEGVEIKCQLVNNELEDKLWDGLVRQQYLLISLYSKAIEVLRITNIDKKKFISQPVSKGKVKSKVSS